MIKLKSNKFLKTPSYYSMVSSINPDFTDEEELKDFIEAIILSSGNSVRTLQKLRESFNYQSKELYNKVTTVQVWDLDMASIFLCLILLSGINKEVTISMQFLSKLLDIDVKLVKTYLIELTSLKLITRKKCKRSIYVYQVIETGFITSTLTSLAYKRNEYYS